MKKRGKQKRTQSKGTPRAAELSADGVRQAKQYLYFPASEAGWAIRCEHGPDGSEEGRASARACSGLLRRWSLCRRRRQAGPRAADANRRGEFHAHFAVF